MTCQETVELMQRYLDHDLTEAEEQELQLHLRQCGECDELFDRLRRLDDELAQLPKVTPSYSLVDAILPQLAELDRLPASFEETAAKESLAAVPVGGIPRTRRAFASWKLASGVAVAAAMIGIFILKEQNLLTPSLAMKSAANGSAESNKAFDAKAVGNANAANGGAAGAKKDAGPGSNANAPLADMKVTDQTTDKSKATTKAPDTALKPAQAQPALPTAQLNEAPRQSGTEDNRVAISSSPSASEESRRSGSTQSSGVGAAANSSQTAPAPNGAASAEPPSPGSEAGAIEPAPAAAPRLKGIAASSVPDGPYAGLAAPSPASAPAAALKSPDGKLVASVEELKVVVRSAETGLTVVASTYGWSAGDIIALVGFGEDGKLKYRVQHPNGADEVTFDTATKAETITAVTAADKK